MESDEARHSLLSFWLVLKSSRKWILACTLTAAAGAGLISSLQPRIFGAKTLLLVSESRITEPDTKVSNFVYYELLKTYETLVANDFLIQKIMENFGLQKAPHQLSVETLKRMLQVSLVKNTRLLEVSVEFPDARMAADIANFFARQAVDLNEEMNAKDRQKVIMFFQKEMAQIQQNLESSNNRLAEFNRTSGIEKIEESVRSLSGQVSQDQTRLSRLKVELSGRLARGAVRLAETDPEVLALKAEVQTLQQVLLAHTRELDEVIQKKTAKEGILSQLSAENNLASENYSALGKRLQEASLRISARTIELQQVAPALPPERPLRPRTPFNILLGAAFGFLASVLLSLLIQNFSSPKRREQERQGEEKLREIKLGSKGY